MTAAGSEAGLSDPSRWYTTNRVGIPAAIIGSSQFNAHPSALTIFGTRETHHGLFALLERSPSLEEAAAVFNHYMEIAFGLAHSPPNPPALNEAPEARRRFRSSYLKLLEGWGFDSNGPQGAVLKGWVESRFGLVPRFHKGVLGRFPSPAWVQYLEEKMSSRFHNNCINLQLDLLFEYCQWSLQRFARLGQDFVTLWRGSNDIRAQLAAPASARQTGVVRLNNLVSFSLSRERADEFGDCTLSTRVPLSKLLFYPGLLGVLRGEDEVLVIGGDYLMELHHD